MTNDFNTLVALEVSITEMSAIEFELGYGRYMVGTMGLPPHAFHMYTIGTAYKHYLLMDDVFRPYAGLGLTGLCYDGLQGPGGASMSQWVGNLEPMIGADFNITKQVAIGARAAYSMPVFNRPATRVINPSGVAAPSPDYAEASIMDSSHVNFLGTVKVAF